MSIAVLISIALPLRLTALEGCIVGHPLPGVFWAWINHDQQPLLRACGKFVHRMAFSLLVRGDRSIKQIQS
jgi:hypothetical protein